MGVTEPIAGEPPEGVATLPEYRVVEMFGVGRSRLAQLAAAGKLRVWKAGRRRAYALDDCRRELESIAEGQDAEPEIAELNGLVRELTQMLRETRQEKAELHRVALDPMAAGVELLKKLLETQSARVTELESGWLAMVHTQEAMLSQKQERELDIRAFENREKRRDNAVEFVKGQVPAALAAWQSQAELKTFVGSLPREILELLVQHGDASLRAKLVALDSTLAVESVGEDSSGEAEEESSGD